MASRLALLSFVIASSTVAATLLARPISAQPGRFVGSAGVRISAMQLPANRNSRDLGRTHESELWMARLRLGFSITSEHVQSLAIRKCRSEDFGRG
jgi:hypothetical protein